MVNGIRNFIFTIAFLIIITTVLWCARPGRLFTDKPMYYQGEVKRSYDSVKVNLADSDESYGNSVELMARVISAEAKGEPYLGQVAVGAVILNRLNHPYFPKTIPGVIFEPDAFTAVTTGHVWYPPVSSSYRAAQDALAGWDPSSGAIYYYNPAKATNWWVAGRDYITQIGRHIFLR